MKDEIKEILENFEKYEARYKLHNETQFIITHREIEPLLDYITNLQEENQKLKELCDKYEKEHSTTFNEWKETITDKYQTLKNLQEENERLKENINDDMTAYLKGLEDGKDKMKECYDSIYKSRNEKAIEFVKKESKKCYSNQTTDDPQKVIGNFMWHTDKLLNILNGGDEE